jgi:ParB-like chromosome segregation protein Spo0J
MPAPAGPAIEFWPLEDLIPYENNARTHSAEQVEQIAASVSQFGFTNPILADRKGITAGHGRLMALRRIYAVGETVKLPNGEPVPPGTAPVIDCTGWSTAQRRAYILADNQLALNAGWDTELLQVEVAALNLADFDLSLLGFDQDRIAALLEGDPNFAPGSEDDQGQLDQLAPKEPNEIDCVCPSCGHEFIKQA